MRITIVLPPISKILKLEHLLNNYSKSPFLEKISESIEVNQVTRIKGMSGSFDAIVASTLFLKKGGSHIFILHDKEEAAYFLDDLSNFIDREKLYFSLGPIKKPISLKKPKMRTSCRDQKC